MSLPAAQWMSPERNAPAAHCERRLLNGLLSIFVPASPVLASALSANAGPGLPGIFPLKPLSLGWDDRLCADRKVAGSGVVAGAPRPERILPPVDRARPQALLLSRLIGATVPKSWRGPTIALQPGPVGVRGSTWPLAPPAGALPDGGSKMAAAPTFPLNAWYAVAWSHEVGRRDILARTLCGRPLALWRTPDNQVAAVDDACWHRLAPLSLGWVEGGRSRLQLPRAAVCRRRPLHPHALPE